MSALVMHPTHPPRAHGLIFAGWSVRALLDGSKTQTRRVMTQSNTTGAVRLAQCDLSQAFPDPGFGDGGYWHAPVVCDRNGNDVSADGIVERLYPRWRIGDRIWVKETWQYADWTDDGYPFVGFRADDTRVLREHYPESWSARITETWATLSHPDNYRIDNRAADRRWRPSVLMPRWASRILLELVDVRAQRLHEITEEDAQAEGATQRAAGWCTDWSRVGLLSRWATGAAEAGVPTPLTERDIALPSARSAFTNVWNGINAPRDGGRYAWAQNPLVWALTFRALEAK